MVRCMRDGEGWSNNYSHKQSHTNPLRVNFVFWAHFSPQSSYLKMALKNEFFDFFQTVCFWKADTELEMDLLEFLGSEVI